MIKLIVGKAMGLINYIKIKGGTKENEKYFVEEERIQKPIKLEVDKKFMMKLIKQLRVIILILSLTIILLKQN